MVVSTVVSETTSVWAIWECNGGTEDWRSGLIPKLCMVRTCNVSVDGGQADTPDLQAWHELPQHATVWFQSFIQHNLCAHSWGHEEVIISPTTPDDWMVIANNNSRRWQYHHCLRAIDGKHVAIRKLMNAGLYYFNYKNFHSIVLMDLVQVYLGVSWCKWYFIRCADIRKLWPEGSYWSACDWFPSSWPPCLMMIEILHISLLVTMPSLCAPSWWNLMAD